MVSIALSVLPHFCLPGKAGLCMEMTDQPLAFCELLCPHHTLVFPFWHYKYTFNGGSDSYCKAELSCAASLAGQFLT